MSSSGGTKSYATLAVLFIAVTTAVALFTAPGAFVAVAEVSAQATKTAIIIIAIAFVVIFSLLSVFSFSLSLSTPCVVGLNRTSVCVFVKFVW